LEARQPNGHSITAKKAQLAVGLLLLGKVYGFLSRLVINETEGMPSTSAYAHRFGSLIRAYQMVGFRPDRDYSYLEINR